jgi:uncharacterized protein (DUF169 family)
MSLENMAAQPGKETEGSQLEPVDRSKIDLVYLHDIILNKLKAERRPVAITYCEDGPPPGYELLTTPACTLIKEGSAGKHVYVAEGNDACLVGQYHIGMHSGNPLITEGEYLTRGQAMFTE